MELQLEKSPHIKYHESATSTMRDTVIALMPLVFMSIFYYGLRALAVIIVSVLTCDLADRICLLVQKKDRAGNISAVITGIIIALLMPASVPYFVVIATGLFAILVVKHPFGGLGNNIFNPACSGVAFSLICWPDKLLNFPEPLKRNMELIGSVTAKLDPGLIATLKGESTGLSVQNGKLTTGSLVTLLIGKYRGPMGVTAAIVVVGCLLFLLTRRAATWHAPVGFILTATLYAIFKPRIQSFDMVWYTSPILEIFSDSFLFTAVFLVSDPVTTPSFRSSKFIFGAGTGFLTMIFREHGLYPEGTMFAILTMNALSGFLDKIILDIKMDNTIVKRVLKAKNDFVLNEEYIELKEKLIIDKAERQRLREERKKELAEKREIARKEAEIKRVEQEKQRAIEKAEREKQRAIEKAEREKLAEEERIKKEELAEIKKVEREKQMAIEKAEKEKLAEEERIKKEELADKNNSDIKIDNKDTSINDDGGKNEK